MEDVIVYDDGSALYNGYHYARKHYALLRRSKDIMDHTKEEWIELCALYDNKCCCCGSDVIGDIPTKDHIEPTVFGGHSGIDNLQPLCRECNVSKGQKTINYRWNG